MKLLSPQDFCAFPSEKGYTLYLPCAEDDRLFFNGYQTWTSCPEYGKYDTIRGIKGLPKCVVRHWGIDRYGDYTFVNYSEAPGKFHGFTYCYVRRGKKMTLFGSLSEADGYTLFFYDALLGALRVEKEQGEPRLFIAEGEDEEELFDAWFAAMGVKRRPAAPMKGYSSWYNRYENISDTSIGEDLAGCAQVLDSGDLFQIDDGWEQAVGDWRAHNVKFPSGMKRHADAIHEKGLKAGLWLAPFVACRTSGFLKSHPAWFLKKDGEPWYCGCNWGGFYALDIDNPEVCAYLKETFRTVFEDWGYDLVKLDFLYAAAPFAVNGEPMGARMTRAVELLRSWCGDKLILGCGVPLGPAFGRFEYCRISCDVGLDWRNSWIMRHTNREIVSTEHAIQNSIFRRQLNGRAFLNDPDVFFLRYDNLRLTEEQKLLLARTNAQYGGLYLTSDNMGAYDDRQRGLYAELKELWSKSNERFGKE